MKKKNWLIVIAVFLVLWLAAGITDFCRVYRFEKPLFCMLSDGADDGGSGHYIGLGYSFEIEGNFMPEDAFPGVSVYTAKLFGIPIKEGVRD